MRLTNRHQQQRKGPDMPPTLKELAIKYLRAKIADGSFPPGSKISDFVISKEIEISRTPVREAINQLASEGLLEIHPRFGACVKTISLHELEELYEIREILESRAAAKAAENSTPEFAAVLRECFLKLDNIRKSLTPGVTILDAETTLVQREYDMKFHRLIIKAAGNCRLEKIIHESRLLSHLFSIMEKEMPVSYLQNACKFHLRILKAVEKKNPTEAETAMREHVKSAMKLACKSASPQITDTVPESLRKFLND